MKNLIKTLTTIAILVTGTTVMQAQETADVNATATVQAALSLTPTAVAFGNVQAGSDPYLNAGSGDATPSDNIGAAATAGSLVITGTANANVIISWANATLVQDGDGLNAATFPPTVVLGGSTITSGNPQGLGGSGSITLGIGGTLDITTNSPTGLITTTPTVGSGTAVVITVQYD